MLKAYPEAAAFLIPNAGKFDFNAYKLLQSQGLKTNKTVTDFVRQVSVAKDRETYYAKKDEYDAMLSGIVDTATKRQISAQWQAWSDEFKGARPLLQEELGKGAQTAIQRNAALSDLQKMLSDKSVKAEPKTRKILKDMLDQYNSFVSARDYAQSAGSGISSESLTILKNGAKDAIRAIAGDNPNAIAAYNSLFAPLFR